ncbi:ABC-2 family transporter protein [Nocardiopsis sp. CC223A]|uniref:ABC transporter permease n=1 Tax=Nocardiopsis sp. CC223A TaxID=3044051 RepID=UPI00279555A2|nr:ABC-2 family transporter protein [Nocardiopsis sp. CC223A]
MEIIRGRLRIAVTYRQNAAFLLAAVVMQIFILRVVWTSLYGETEVVNDVNLSSMLVYLTIANLQNWALQDPSVSSYIHSRVREGQVAFDLLRPAGFVPQMLAHLVGSSLAMVLFAVAALPVVALAGTLGPPVSAAAFATWLVSLLCAYLVALLLNLILGMVAFWTMEITGIGVLYYLVNQFFAGALVPLDFFPEGLGVLARLLPFQATTYTPVAIYVGRITGTDALLAIGVQVVWIAVLVLFARLLWRAAVRRVIVQGG